MMDKAGSGSTSSPSRRRQVRSTTRTARGAAAAARSSALAYFLPEDMELVVLVNSPVDSPEQFFRNVVTDVLP